MLFFVLRGGRQVAHWKQESKFTLLELILCIVKPIKSLAVFTELTLKVDKVGLF